MMRSMIVFVWAAALVLGGCAVQVEEIASVQSSGDVAPFVTPNQLRASNFDNLSPGEVIVVSEGNARQLSRPNPTKFDLIRTLRAGVLYDPEMAETASCGIIIQNDVEDLEIPCTPVTAGTDYVRIETLQLLRSPSRQPPEKWAAHAQLDVKDIKGDGIDIDYALVIVNTGTIPFTGTLSIYGRLDRSLVFDGLKKVSLVADQRVARRALAGVPLFGLFAIEMENFEELSAYAFGDVESQEDLLIFSTETVTLGPRQGVRFIFRARYPVPGDKLARG